MGLPKSLGLLAEEGPETAAVDRARTVGRRLAHLGRLRGARDRAFTRDVVRCHYPIFAMTCFTIV